MKAVFGSEKVQDLDCIANELEGAQSKIWNN